MESQFFVEWEAYKQQHPEIAEIKAAEIIQNYEEDIYRYVFSLFM